MRTVDSLVSVGVIQLWTAQSGSPQANCVRAPNDQGLQRSTQGPSGAHGAARFKGEAMAVSIILHRVADYDAWRKVYDSVSDMQNDGGVSRASVYRMADDPNNVLVIHHFDNVETAKAFFGRKDLKEAMQRGGVQGEPRIEIFE
jgi:hypothetical protein